MLPPVASSDGQLPRAQHVIPTTLAEDIAQSNAQQVKASTSIRMKEAVEQELLRFVDFDLRRSVNLSVGHADVEDNSETVFCLNEFLMNKLSYSQRHTVYQLIILFV